jgi:nucleoside 2-deoxyribosyltransferase
VAFFYQKENYYGVLEMITVYTCGAMEHVSEDAMKGWRAHLEDNLPDVKFLHPTRRMPLHQQMEDASLATYNKLKRIVAQDIKDINESDLIVANLKDSEPGKKWGSVMEVALAWERGIPVIAIVDEKQFKHPFIYTMCTEVHHTLEDAIDAVQEYY